jgi:hypothetical protein
VSTPGEPLSFADFASSHPHVDGYQTLDHVGTARTQQVRSVFIAFAKIAIHLIAPIRKAGHSPELAAFCIGESRTRMDIPDGCAKTVDDMQKRICIAFSVFGLQSENESRLQMTSALSCEAKGQILWLGFGGMWGGTERRALCG